MIGVRISHKKIKSIQHKRRKGTLSRLLGYILYDSSPTLFASVSGDETVRLWNVVEEGLGDWLGWEARRDAATGTRSFQMGFHRQENNQGSKILGLATRYHFERRLSDSLQVCPAKYLRREAVLKILRQ